MTNDVTVTVYIGCPCRRCVPCQPFDTEPDQFGLFRSYISCSTYEPDEEISLDSVCDSEAFAVATREGKL